MLSIPLTMFQMIKSFLLFTLSMLLMSSGCSKDNNAHDNTLKELFLEYRDGEISECTFKGSKVYIAGLNAHDAGNEIFDREGKKIGSCYYSTGQVDELCNQLENCVTIYRCDNHISGQPAVDKYGLLK
jgi:hypothetical protein